METKTEIEGITLTTDFTQEDIDYSIKRHAEIFDGEYGFKPFFNDMVAKLIGDFPSIYKEGRDFMLVAHADGKFAGTIPLLGEETGRARLRYFFVEPFTRGRGVGKLIFTTAMKKAKEMGYNHLYFSTYSVLKVARTMYRELGFTVTDSYDDEEVGNGVKEEIWEKDI